MTRILLTAFLFLPISAFGQNDAISAADVNSDGCVTVADVLGVLQVFGACSADTSLERTWYFFHGIDSDYLAMTGGGLLDSLTNYGLMNAGVFSGTSTTDFSQAFEWYLSWSDSLDCGNQIQTLEFPLGGELSDVSGTFPEITCGGLGAYYYLAVPDNTLAPNLIEYGVVFPSPGCSTTTAGRLGFTINNTPYWIYIMSGAPSTAERSFSFN